MAKTEEIEQRKVPKNIEKNAEKTKHRPSCCANNDLTTERLNEELDDLKKKS